MRRGPFLFFFSFSFFFFFLFIFCFFAFHFSKPLKFVLGLPKWKFSTGKKHFTLGKNQENNFAPPKMFPLTPLVRSAGTLLVNI